MPTTRRRRRIDASAEAAWRVVGDPGTQARWWPKVRRVDDVRDEGFTRVYGTSKGRALRADFVLAERGERTATWDQVVEGSPFERVLHALRLTVSVEPAGDGSAVVELRISQTMRGLSKLGGVLVRRATRRQLDEALDALEPLVR